MLKQLSSGVVVYKIGDNLERTYLLLQYPGKYWDFPKGKLEQGEKWVDAALRETREETGLTVAVDTQFDHSYTYSFNDFRGNRVEKTVVFFIAQAEKDAVVQLSYEHIDFLWLNYQQARMQVYFESVRQLLTEVENYLNQKQCGIR